jgi:hypothetical protein
VRVAFAQAQQEFETEALKHYPDLGKKESALSTEIGAILKVMPWVKQSPDYKLVLADFIRGRNLRVAQSKAAKGQAMPTRKAAPSREPTRIPTEAPMTGVETEEPGEKPAKDAEQRFRTTGRTSDLAKSFAAKSRANRAK